MKMKFQVHFDKSDTWCDSAVVNRFVVASLNRYIIAMFSRVDYGLIIQRTHEQTIQLNVGVVESRWAPRSSKSLGGVETAPVGSTPIHSRNFSR